MNKLLIFIVAYQRKSYTQGTIELLSSVRPLNTDIIVWDNGSTDGTREWLTENQEKYQLGLLFADDNVRVGGAWKALTTYFDEDSYDYVLLLDNDGWLVQDKDWYKKCLEIFNSDKKIVSLGLQKERKPGYFSMEKTFDPNYNSKVPFNELEIYDTVFYAAFRLDRFKEWHRLMKNWSYNFIGDKIGREYNLLGLRAVKVTPGFVLDISEFNFDNKEHLEYNIEFYKKERDDIEFVRRTKMHSTTENDLEYIRSLFGNKFLSYL